MSPDTDAKTSNLNVIDISLCADKLFMVAIGCMFVNVDSWSVGWSRSLGFRLWLVRSECVYCTRWPMNASTASFQKDLPNGERCVSTTPPRHLEVKIRFLSFGEHAIF